MEVPAHARARRVALLAVVVAIAAGAATAVAAWLPDTRLAERSLPLQAAIETGATLVALLATHLLGGRFARTRARSDLLLTSGLAVLAASGLAFAALPDALGARDGALAAWAGSLGTVLATVLLAWGPLASDAKVADPARWRRRALVLSLGALGVVTGAIALVDPATGIVAGRSPAESPLLSAAPGLLVTQLVAAIGFAVAAVGLVRRARRSDDELLTWFAIGAVLAAVSRADYFLVPVAYASWISLGEVLWVGFYVLLLVGEVRELGSYQRDLGASARAEERRRVARELHDGLAQEVAFIAMVGERVEAGLAGEREVRALRRAADRATSESRMLIDALADPQDRPLAGALADATADVAERGGADLYLEVDDGEPMSSPVREAVLRIVQEGVANAVRHGEATRVDVAVSVNGDVRVCVADDGAGFDAGAKPNGGFGLTSMRQRALALGGELEIASRPGAGTRLQAVLPVDA
jgi:signal transduction histidine kinase